MYVYSAKSGGSETPLLSDHGILMTTPVKAEAEVCDLPFSKQLSFSGSREADCSGVNLQPGILL